MESGTSGVEARIYEALLPLARARSSTAPPAYVRRHLVEHAAAGHVLDGRIVNGDFLPYVDADRLRTVLGSVHDDGGVAEQWRQAAYRWRWDSPPANSAFLEFRSVAAGRPVKGAGATSMWSTKWARCELGAGQVIGLLPRPALAVATLLLPDGRPVAVTGGDDGTVRVWDLGTGTPAGEPLTGHTGEVVAVATLVLPDGRPVAVTGSYDATVRVWDLGTGTPVGEPLTGHTGEVVAVATLVLPGGRPVAVTGSWDDMVRVWDLGTGTPLGEPLTGHTGRVYAVATLLLPDGRPVAVTGSDDATVRVWDLGTGTPLGQPLAGHTDTVSAVATLVFPDGRPVAVTGSADATVRVWDLATGTPLGQPLTGHTGPVSAVAILVLPGGRPVAITGSDDATVRVWDLTSGACMHLLPLPGSITSVDSAVVDGRPCVVVGGDGIAAFWL